MLEVISSPRGVRVIPPWAETAWAKQLQQSDGFQSYYAVQHWLAETLRVEAE